MFNWAFNFIYSNGDILISSGFVFAICNLVISEFFDIAFHGKFKIRIANNGDTETNSNIIFRGIRRRKESL